MSLDGELRKLTRKWAKKLMKRIKENMREEENIKENEKLSIEFRRGQIDALEQVRDYLLKKPR